MCQDDSGPMLTGFVLRHHTQYIYWEHAQFEFRLYPLKKYKNTVLLMFIHFINTKLTCIKTEINVQEKSVKA